MQPAGGGDMFKLIFPAKLPVVRSVKVIEKVTAVIGKITVGGWVLSI
jgi:hypothetical protein